MLYLVQSKLSHEEADQTDLVCLGSSKSVCPNFIDLFEWSDFEMKSTKRLEILRAKFWYLVRVIWLSGS